MKQLLAAAGLGCIGLVAAAHAGVTDLNITLDGGASSLFLADGTYDEGTDWTWHTNPNGSAAAFPTEDWIGPGPVTLGNDVTYDGANGTVRIYKYATNHTGFDWTDFHITVTPDPGTTALVNLTGSTRFSDITVQPNGDGTTDIWYFTNLGAGDTPVGAGEVARLDVQVRVTGAGSFSLTQHPTPEPTTLALLALGGLAALRRR